MSVCTARAPAARDVWLSWVTTLLQMIYSERYSCSHKSTDRRLFLPGKGTETQAGHNSSEVRRGQSPGYFYVDTSGVSAKIFRASGSPIYMDHHYERKKPARTAVVMEKVEISMSSVFVGDR